MRDLGKDMGRQMATTDATRWVAETERRKSGNSRRPGILRDPGSMRSVVANTAQVAAVAHAEEGQQPPAGQHAQRTGPGRPIPPAPGGCARRPAPGRPARPAAPRRRRPPARAGRPAARATGTGHRRCPGLPPPGSPGGPPRRRRAARNCWAPAAAYASSSSRVSRVAWLRPVLFPHGGVQSLAGPAQLDALDEHPGPVGG